MDTSMAFDTLAYAKKLKAVGFTDDQAETQVLLLSEVLATQLSTKADIAQVDVHILEIRRDIELIRRDMKEMDTGLKRDMEAMETGLKHDMREMETGLKRDMKEMETGLKRDMKEMETGFKREMKALEDRMVIKLGGLMVVAVGAMATLIKIL